MKRKIKSSLEKAQKQGLGSVEQLLQTNNHAWKEKISFKTILAGFFIQCGWPICFYFSYVYCGDILKNAFSFSADQIIHHNFFVSVVQVVSFIIFILLSIKIYPLKLLRAKIFVFLPFALAVPYLLGIADTPYMIAMVQFICIFFSLNGGPSMGIIISHFPVFRRFSYNSFIYALARALIYTATSFGLVYLTDFFGNYGLILILLPACLTFMWATNHFYELERTAGNIGLDRETTKTKGSPVLS